MNELVERVVSQVGIDRAVAEKSVGIILDFLSKEGPADKVQSLLARLPDELIEREPAIAVAFAAIHLEPGGQPERTDAYLDVARAALERGLGDPALSELHAVVSLQRARSRGDLTLAQQGTILLVAMLTSKGASGITGAGFITLAATLAVVDPRLVPGMAIVLGIDKFMSECRALTNLCGNGVACVVVAWWEGELDRDKLAAGLSKQIDPTDMETAITTG